VFAVLGFIVFGLVVGIVARLLVPGTKGLGLGLTLAIGIAGSVVGGLVASWAGTGDIWELNILGSLVAFASAAVLLAIVTASSQRIKA
jgi:uncharacterized membrane protein YeaQ/YmgE (transglycosylase-associated protein family)